MFIFNIVIAVMLAGGLFLIACDLFRVPTYKTSRAMIGTERQNSKKQSRINSMLDDLAKWLAGKIRLRDFKKAQIQANLDTARMPITPELYISQCIVKAGIVAVMSILVFPMFTAGGIAVLLFAFIYYLSLVQELGKKVDSHRKAVEYELGQFVFTIQRSLQHGRNITVMLQNYREICGPDMRQEVDITLADMFSGNHEQAISRMEVRLGSAMVSDVCRGLISVIHGDDTTAYWVNLEQKFAEHQRNELRDKANKIPAKVSRLSMAMLFAFLGLWLGVLIMQMAEALGELFGML